MAGEIFSAAVSRERKREKERERKIAKIVPWMVAIQRI